jgi:dTDP-4-dehydrorhamnose reductase
MRRLLITGGTGYLGAELVRLAVAAGWDVTASYLATEPAAGPSAVHWRRLDVTDRSAVHALVSAVAPDAVVHTAYVRDGPRAAEVTIGGAAAVAQAARVAGARLAALSTDVVFDGELAGAYTEDDRARPISAYGAAKLAAEAAVLGADPHALVVRTSLLYGGPLPGPHEEAALAAAQGERAGVFFTDEVRCPTQVGDLAAALLELVHTDAAGPLHVAGADAVSRLEFARLVVAAAGLPADRLRGGPSRDAGPGRPRNCALDCTRAGRLVTAPPRGVYEVLGMPARPGAAAPSTGS